MLRIFFFILILLGAWVVYRVVFKLGLVLGIF